MEFILALIGIPLAILTFIALGIFGLPLIASFLAAIPLIFFYIMILGFVLFFAEIHILLGIAALIVFACLMPKLKCLAVQ